MSYMCTTVTMLGANSVSFVPVPPVPATPVHATSESTIAHPANSPTGAAAIVNGVVLQAVSR